jgi:hypothetical protein
MGLAGEFGSWRHLAQRFAGALSPAGPAPADEAWALARLLPGEQELWRRMSGPDRRHAVGVARDTLRLLDGGAPGGEGGADGQARSRGQARTGSDARADGELLTAGDIPAAEREVAASALLHDVGKVESGLGTFSRVGVTLAALTVGRERLTRPAPAGGSEPRWRTRVRAYLVHDRLGADMLRQAGSAPLTVAWAAEHHLDPSRWTVDRRVGEALKAADGD